MKVVVVSDFHLKFDENKEDIERKKKVLSFLDKIKGNVDILVLNGDIFDLWYVWRKVIIKDYFPILRKFADIKDSGCRIIFLSGNHDFWFNNFLKEQIGIEIFQDSFSETIDGKKYFIAHGDIYTINDWRYQVFRSIIRNKIIMFFFSILHPDFSLNIGKKMSRSSRSRRLSDKKQKIKEAGLDIKAKELLEKYDIVLFGHTHNAKIFRQDTKIYINTGDWINSPSYYAQIVDGDANLIKYNQK